MKPWRPPESLSQSDWQQTPPTVQAYLLNLHQRLVQLQQQIERLQNRLQRTAKTSDKPPSSDSPFQSVNGTERCPVFGKIRCPIFCTLRNSNLGCYPEAALPSSSFTATLSIPALRLVLSR